MPNLQHLVKLGVVTGPHGIKGAVKLRVFLENPQDLSSYSSVEDNLGRPCCLEVLERKTGESFSKTSKNVVIVRLNNAKDRTQAEALKGLSLYVPRHTLPPLEEDQFYHTDLIGLCVKTSSQTVGTVVGVLNFGAGDILDIQTLDGKSVYVAFRKEFVPIVDVQGGFLCVEDSCMKDFQ